MIHFITLQRGDAEILKKWVSAFNLCYIPHGSIVSVVIDKEKVSNEIINAVEEIKTMAEIVLDDGFHPSNNDKESREYNIEKSRFVAEKNSTYSLLHDKDLTCFWNDDVLATDFKTVVNCADNIGGRIVASVGLYPEREDPSTSLVRRKGNRSKYSLEELSGKREYVFCGSPGFSFYSTKYLKEILPIVDWREAMDTSFYIGLRMEDDGKSCMCDGRIILDHK